MVVVDTVCSELSRIAPLKLAEEWDNVGLLVGDRRQSVCRVMTCLTISENVADEAIQRGAELVVTHHPLPFRPLQRLTTDVTSSVLLLKLIRGGVAVYSAHTAFDSADGGINQMWANRLQLANIRPLVESPEPAESAAAIGAGRYGELPRPMSLAELVQEAARLTQAQSPQLVGDRDKQVSRIAIACGSGGSFLSAAKRCRCDAMLTGEATFHTCLEAESIGISLGLLGHYASERFAMETLADRLKESFPAMEIWASRAERDPLSAL